MTSSFAFAPSIMSSAHCDSYSNDSYPEFLHTSQPYPASSGFTEPSFGAALSTFDSFPAHSAFSDVSNTQEGSFFALNRSESANAYSPVQSPGEHLVPPRLSSSSESSASVHSTSSSAMASPHLQPQFQVEHWNSLSSGDGIPAESSEMPSHEIYFSPPSLEGGSKMSGYVGESKFVHSGFSPSSVHHSFVSQSPTATGSSRLSEPLSAASTRSSSGSEGSFRSPEPVFKAPGSPASSRQFRFHSSNRAQRRNSLLSNQVYPEPDSQDSIIPSPPVQCSPSHSSHTNSSSFHSCWSPPSILL
jgi:hypothetical protein